MSYINFINCYKQNSLAKKKYYYYLINKKSKIILRKFIELGLIRYVSLNKTNSNQLKITINYSKNEPIFKFLKVLYQLGRKKNINLKTLQSQKAYKTNSMLLLLTSKGVLTNFEALSQHTGGILLCQIIY